MNTAAKHEVIHHSFIHLEKCRHNTKAISTLFDDSTMLKSGHTLERALDCQTKKK